MIADLSLTTTRDLIGGIGIGRLAGACAECCALLLLVCPPMVFAV
jgi:hypothetical protein